MFNIKNYPLKKVLIFVLSFLILIFGLFYIINTVKNVSSVSTDIFATSVRVRTASEDIDKIFERAEVNTTLLSETIYNLYDVSQQQNKDYNYKFIKNLDGLVKSVLANSPGADGAWFQINANLPFSVQAYSWYGIRDNAFINIKEELAHDTSEERKITPENDPYYFNAVLSQGAVWSGVYTDADTQDSMITISAPITKDGVLIGVAGIDISMKTLLDSLTSMQLILGESELFLFNDKDKLILSKLYNQPDNVNKNFNYLYLLKQHMYESIGYYDGITKKTAIMLTLTNKYNLVITFVDGEFISNLNNLVRIVYILYALVIILILSKFVHINIKMPEFKKKVPPVKEETQEQTEDTPKSDEEI